MFLVCLLALFPLLHANRLVEVCGYIDLTTTQIVSTITSTTSDSCWKSAFSYDVGMWTEDGTCYLTWYEFVSKIYSGQENGSQVVMNVMGNSCGTGFTDGESEYFNITWDGTGSTWAVTVKNNTCAARCHYSIRGDTVVCYGNMVYSIPMTHASAAVFMNDLSMILSSPPGVIEPVSVFTPAKFNKSRIITDGVRSSTCNTASTINTTACQYPEGFDFLDPGNPMHSTYEFVTSPNITVDNQCVALLFDSQDSTINGKFDFISCNDTCDNGYCSYFAIGTYKP